MNLLPILPLLLLFSSDPVCDKSGVYCSVPLDKGESAPYKGQLLTTELAVSLGMKADSCDQKIGVERNFLLKKHVAELAGIQAACKLDMIGCQEKTDILEQRLVEASHRSWYEHPLFVAGLTFGVTSVLILGAQTVMR